MSNVAKLKKKAAELEQKKQFDKALAVYVELLQQIGGKEEDTDVALYNRVGDLMVRQGQIAEAVEHYERAVDLYAEGGFFNNAIALCNKILRTSPGRASIYYKLGRISAKKGFASDAKQNYLEYADRMQKSGKMDEAFRALKEFADLCPDQDDIRLMLAEQLAKKARNGEALEQLQLLYEKFEQEGRQAEARATMDRMKAIDPEASPKAAGTGPKAKPGELVFLDVTFDERPKTQVPRRSGGAKPVADKPHAPSKPAPPPNAPPSPAKKPPAELPPMPKSSSDLPFLDLADQVTQPSPPSAPMEPLIEGGGIEPSEVDSMRLDGSNDFLPSIDTSFGGDSLLGLEQTMMSPDVEAEGGQTGSLLDIESTAFGSSGITHDDLGGDYGAIAPLEDFDASIASGAELVELELSDTEADTPEPPEHDLALPGELPALASPEMRASTSVPGMGDLELIMPDEEPDAPASHRRSAQEAFESPIARDGAEDLADSINFDLPTLNGAEPPLSRPPAPSRAPSRHGGSADPLDALRLRVNSDSGNPALRRQLAEALFERGARDDGLSELELAMIGFERQSDLESAASVADEIIRLNPNSVRHHQKRVEYAFRTNDRGRLVEAYLELADALFRSSQADKARTVYQRVLELSPDDVRAQAALSTFIEPTAAPSASAHRKSADRPPERSERSGVFRRYTGEAKKPAEPPPPPPVERNSPMDASFVNLGEWLRDDDQPKSTRMIVQEQAPTGDEKADFADMLRRFKQGVAENVEEEDHQSHYDLGVAYKEMGLLDEAIAEFQKALRGPENRVRAYEALGQCFLEKSQFQVAATLLGRALLEPNHDDEQLVGVLYLLGYCSEALQLWSDALRYYQRVAAVDIEFRDVSERISSLERVAK
jgi:tetratricopeptide (TPR) repeat protein